MSDPKLELERVDRQSVDLQSVDSQTGQVCSVDPQSVDPQSGQVSAFPDPKSLAGESRSQRVHSQSVIPRVDRYVV